MTSHFGTLFECVCEFRKSFGQESPRFPSPPPRKVRKCPYAYVKHYPNLLRNRNQSLIFRLTIILSRYCSTYQVNAVRVWLVYSLQVVGRRLKRLVYLSWSFYKPQYYHRFRWYATSENKTSAETFPKFPSFTRVIDRSDRNPPITATRVTLWFLYVMLAGCDWWMSIQYVDNRKTDENFGNVSAGVLFSKVAYQRKRW